MSSTVDTFSDIPEAFLTPALIDELLCQLKQRSGVVLTGLASSAYKCDSPWGRPVKLTDEEQLQIRVYPKGCLSAGRLYSTNSTVMVAARRTGNRISDNVSIAILWAPSETNIQADLEHEASRHSTVGCRNLHIFLPSLFNHHDPAACNDRGRMHSTFPVLDDYNFHAVRPSSVTITQNPSLQGGFGRFSVSTGLSQFVIAGHFAGVEVEDVSHRAAEPVIFARWNAACRHYADLLHQTVGSRDALLAMHNSLTAIELLTCEGLLGILSHEFTDGALPDMLHMPNGFPLLIAFAVRIACYPQRFKMLSNPTASDKWANSELISIFESNWTPLNTNDNGEVRFYAIDAAIKSAYKDAYDAASQQEPDTSQAVVDNLAFWHRAGQQCINSIFGSRLEDYFQVPSPYGRCEALQDPLVEARQTVLRSHLSPVDCNPYGINHVSLQMGNTEQKKHTLLIILNSVENWLRTGRYATQQISAKNSPDNMTVPRTMRKQEFQEMLQRGVQESVDELLEEGDDREQAIAAANLMRNTMETALANYPPETQVALTFGIHDDDDPEEVEQRNTEARMRKKHAKRDTMLDKNEINVAAFAQASSAVAAAFCQGPMLHHQFSLGCFLTSKSATSACADCDTQVHVLTAMFLGSRYNACARCCRARCLSCEARAIKCAKDTGTRKGSTTGCLRCKDVLQETRATSKMKPAPTAQTGKKTAKKVRNNK